MARRGANLLLGRESAQVFDFQFSFGNANVEMRIHCEDAPGPAFFPSWSRRAPLPPVPRRAHGLLMQQSVKGQGVLLLKPTLVCLDNTLKDRSREPEGDSSIMSSTVTIHKPAMNAGTTLALDASQGDERLQGDIVHRSMNARSLLTE
eukprot:1142007-Pelagomonas_calceolata.AAC.1